ncbi:unnamed protein product [Microthlaspi erraticum]|uniref:Branchpoint-bridging protein n=1 Tax=Microthlaspi erraticum TaxID=1685480 RepID=A0A6D2ISL3_9BRAS|nr:unnamed protein product [Microthlaspi erraticum]
MDSVDLNASIPSSHALDQPLSSSEAVGDKDASIHLRNPQISSSSEFMRPLQSDNGISTTLSGTEKDKSSGEDETTSGKRKRRSRWDSPSKRKSRWADDEPKPVIQLPDFMNFDPEIQELNVRLLEISRILQSGLPLDDRSEGHRSPSPEPIYDNNGVRVNTREYRAKERLIREKQEIISQIINKNPAFKPPADYRPPKLQKKLFIPDKEFPGYGFVGLIIGPRGNTQKRMQKETGAKIVIRGRGSVKDGRKKDMKFDPSENEDLHVLVEAATQEALDAAVGMIEKLLQPVDEVRNEHKRQQLRELATLNGTVRDEEICRHCGEPGHRQYACPSIASTFKSDVLCKICGDGGHPTIDCPVKGTTGKKMDDEYQKFLSELGGSGPESSLKQSTTLALGSGSNPQWGNKAGLGSSPTKPSQEYDETNLYIGHLPSMLKDDDLINLFSSFGEIVKAKVIKDHESGMSRGYGFVKYADVQMANAAIQAMNGYWLDGKTLAVRIAGKPPPTQAYSPSNQLPGAYPSSQYANGGKLQNPPPPPVPSYYPYAPPHTPPGSYHPVPGQHMSPYGMYYPPPPPPPPPPPGTASQSPSSSQSFPPGVQQPPYMSYPSYYNAVPPPPPPPVPASSTDYPQSMGNKTWANSPPLPTSDHSQGLGNPPVMPTAGYSQSMGNVTWAPKPPVKRTAENPSAVGESEYDKFMAEMMM